MNLGGGSKGGAGGIRRILAPIGNGVLAIIWQKLSNKRPAKHFLFSPGFFFMVRFFQVNDLRLLQSKMHREICGKKMILAWVLPKVFAGKGGFALTGNTSLAGKLFSFSSSTYQFQIKTQVILLCLQQNFTKPFSFSSFSFSPNLVAVSSAWAVENPDNCNSKTFVPLMGKKQNCPHHQEFP